MTESNDISSVDPLWGEPIGRPAALPLARDGWSLTLAAHGIEEIELDGVALFPRIFFSVRDANWATPRLITRWEFPADGAIAFSGQVEGMPLSLHGELTTSSTELRIRFVAHADDAVAVARVGPCVLHPANRVGTRVTLDDTGDELFSDSIGPSPVMSGARTMVLDLAERSVAVELQGSTWETEDQRNWGDATYKSYSPPLGEPRPMLFEPGQERKWILSVRAAKPATPASRSNHPVDREIRLIADAAAAPMPALGLTHQGGALPDGAVASLSRLGLDFLHLLIDLDDDDWEQRFTADLLAARQLSVAAVATVGCSPADHGRLSRIAELGAGVLDTALVFDAGSALTSPALATAAASAFRGTGLVLGGGSRGHFASINRAHGAPDELGIVSVPLAVAAHDDDRRALMSGPSSFAAIAEQTRRMTGDRPLFIGPVGFLPTFDSWAADTGPGSAERTWSRGHPRQPSVFSAAWHVAALSRLVPLSATRVCIAGTVGGRGVGEVDGARFRPFPLFAALEAVAAFGGKPVTPVADGERIAGLHAPGRTVIGVATDDIRAFRPGGRALMPDASWQVIDPLHVPTPTVVVSES